MSLTYDELLRQAHMTSHDYFIYARSVLRDSGLDYTAADVIALATISAQDYHTGVITKLVEEGIKAIGYMMERQQ